MPTYIASPAEQIQRNPVYYSFIKSANTIGYFSVLYITWRFLTHHLDWQLATGCVIISACWLILTRIKVDHLLQTYFDVLSRIELILPVVLGISLSIAAEVAHSRPLYHCLALSEICGWLYIFVLFRRNQKQFIKQGYGPVPRGTWVNPPASALRSGDLILTSGNIARGLHESVGHAEMVIHMPDNRWMLFSSYMDKGCCLHPLEELTGPDYKGYYIGLHLKKAWTEEEEKKAAGIAEEMVAANKKWAAEENVRVGKRIDFLPLPSALKEKLKKALHVTGYDWFGTFMGRVAKGRWTCIGAAVELYHRMGIHTNSYGTGLLGFGTTILDPIMPVRFLSDDAFNLIKEDSANLVDTKQSVVSS